MVFFPSLKHNFIAYRSSKVSSRPDCIFEIHQQWQSGFSRVYSNCCGSCSFEAGIIKIGLSSHKMYSYDIVNFQVSMTILNAFTKNRYENLLKAPYIYIYIYIWELIFLFIADFLSSSWVFFFCCFFFHYVSAEFHLWPSSGDLTATSDRNAESCNCVPSNYCLP